MSDNDREIVMLRNFEHLSNVEAAQVLGIQSELPKMLRPRTGGDEGGPLPVRFRPLTRRRSIMQEPWTDSNHEQLLADAIDEFTQLLNEGNQPCVHDFADRYADCREVLAANPAILGGDVPA